MSKTLTDDEVRERAQRWARLHKIEKYRPQMDEVLNGLSADDQRRVYLCGQRIAGGLPFKVIPPAQQGKEEADEQTKGKAAKKRPAATAAGRAATAQERKAMGANSVTKKANHARKDSSDKKR
jgi:hypothetical protein